MTILFNEEKGVKVYFYDRNTSNEHVLKYIKHQNFKADYNEILPVFQNGKLEKIYIGLGELAKHHSNRKLGFELIKHLKKLHINQITFDFNNMISEQFLFEILEGMIYSSYQYYKYKTDKKENNLDLYLNNFDEKTINKVNNLINIFDGIKVSRDLTNAPSNEIYPESYAHYLVKLFENTNVNVKVYDQKQMEEMGLTAALSVNMGSDKPARFVVLEYLNNPKDKDNLVCLVGKGVTYDSGGYAIKSASNMYTMSYDMAGSATVVGTIRALQLNNVKQNVVGVMALVENLINGSAYKNGDIVKTLKGTTIFIGNTDAEGRVTLADSIYYAKKTYNPKAIIELSTLTGACLVALGDDVCGVVSDYKELFNQLFEAGKNNDEVFHLFPITDKIKDAVKHHIADLTNTPRGYGRAISAGVFLQHFADDIPYAHLDIAGPAFTENTYSYYNYGATGFGIKTLYNLISKFNFKKLGK